MGRALKQMLYALLTLSALCPFVPSQAAASEGKLQICAVTQLYDVLEDLKPLAPQAFESHVGTSEELYALIANGDLRCDVLLSSDERLPVTLVRAAKADALTLKPFTRAELILWSPDKNFFKDPVAKLMERNLRSLAYPDARLTPVGFAAHELLTDRQFPGSYLKDRLYVASQEYAVQGMVEAGYVECGFITRPLITGPDKQPAGSYWLVPRGYYPDLLYYSIILEDSAKRESALAFTAWLRQDVTVEDRLSERGFAPLLIDNEPYRELLPHFKIRR